MATFRGFSTINKYKKFGMTDFNLIKRDLMNAFMIREGEVPGRPDLGTRIWNFVFEQSVDSVRTMIEDEVRRIIDGDPRITLSSINISYNHNTVIIETAVILAPNTSPERMLLMFNSEAESVNIV